MNVLKPKRKCSEKQLAALKRGRDLRGGNAKGRVVKPIRPGQKVYPEYELQSSQSQAPPNSPTPHPLNGCGAKGVKSHRGGRSLTVGKFKPETKEISVSSVSADEDES